MKASHLAAIMMAGIGIGGMASCGIPSDSFPANSNQYQKNAIIPRAMSLGIDISRFFSAGPNTGPPPGSYRKLNQRQIRRNRRRSSAAGNKKAFK